MKSKAHTIPVEKSRIWKHIPTGEYFLSLSKMVITDICQPVGIILTVDGDIEMLDNFIMTSHINSGIFTGAIIEKENELDPCRKVIATHSIPNHPNTISDEDLPEVIKAINEGREIEVEYEPYMTDGWVPSYNNPDNNNFDESAEMDYRPKYDGNGFIVLKRGKETFQEKLNAIYDNEKAGAEAREEFELTETREDSLNLSEFKESFGKYQTFTVEQVNKMIHDCAIRFYCRGEKRGFGNKELKFDFDQWLKQTYPNLNK